MNKIILLAFAGLISANAYCQRSNTNVLKLAVDKTKHFAINTSNASIDIEGYDGDELIVEAITNKEPAPVPPDAAGLTKIPFAMRPAEDNVINYKQIDQTSFLNQISITTKCNYLHIKVPNNIILFSINSQNTRYANYITFSNYKGAFQLEGSASTANISKVTGPFKVSIRAESLSIKDVSWSANAAWPFDPSKLNLTSPYMIRSTLNSYPNIDITVPADLKAGLFLTSREGNVYSNLPLSGDVNITNAYKPILMNGGGVKIEIDGGNGNIYLRKQ